MGESTPQQFAAKLNGAAIAVKHQNPKALEAHALVTKHFIVTAAERRTHKAKANWVSFKIVGDVAMLRLRGGLGHLIQEGSYKHPEGWTEPGARTLGEHKALNTPYGPYASVHHPPVAAKPFWREGVAASRQPGKRAYEKVIHTTIRSAL